MSLDDPPTAPEEATAAGPVRWRKWVLLGVVLTLAAGLTVMLGVGFGRDPSVVASTRLNKPAPPLAGPTLDGGRVDLRNYRGKVVLVNVWASWCAACKEEHPILTEAQRQLGPRGLQIIGINMNDTRADAQRFLAEMGGATYPSVVDPEARIAIKWGTFGIPETYLVTPDGIIVEKAVGAIDAPWIENRVMPLLEG